ncbi:hypothetical protein LTR10_007912 [Elasticomyces elasticus]|nr:hypothetical protein LTR10_007912 [Elasticomyces elasticus]
MEPFKVALEQRADKARPQKSPCIGLTTSTLLVSRAMHNVAARVFYEQNTFSFPSATSAWMLLESFLVTIGANNVGRLRSLQIHVPIWRHGVNHDYIEGAIMDLASPVSRLAVIKPQRVIVSSPPSSTASMLCKRQDCEARKQKGAKLLKGLALSSLKGNQPVLNLSHLIRSTELTSQNAIKRLSDLREEAAEYGWQVVPPTSRHVTAAVPSNLQDTVAVNLPLARNGLGRTLKNKLKKTKNTRKDH